MIKKFTDEEINAVEELSLKMSAAARSLNEEIKAFNRVIANRYVEVELEREKYEKLVVESRNLLANLWGRVFHTVREATELNGPKWMRTDEGQNLTYWMDLLNHHFEVEELEVHTPGVFPEMQPQEDLSHNLDVPMSLEELANRF
jgi:hypothetical protein